MLRCFCCRKQVHAGVAISVTMAVVGSAKANSLAIERMREMDELDRLNRINTKQKLGTPIVRRRSKKGCLMNARNSVLRNGFANCYNETRT